MADRYRRFALGAVALPMLFLMMSGLAQAVVPNFISVTTLSGGSVPGACSLTDAIKAANGSPVAGTTCSPGTGDDFISFAVTGLIVVDSSNLPFAISDPNLTIVGPSLGCTGVGPCGISIDGISEATGGIFVAESGTSLTLSNLAIISGLAPFGGAIYANGNNLEIDHCLFFNNEASDIVTNHGGKGGAIYINSAGTVSIINSTFSGNFAQAGTVAPTGSVGGAIADMNNSATLKITASTFSGNEAGAGGVYAAMAKPFVKSSIFVNSIGNNCETVTPHDLGYNVADDASCGFSGTSVDSPNAHLGPLQNNGGPTDTFALGSGSVALDRIPIANCTDQSSNPITNDQRLFGRPDPANLNTCDSGAYEADAVGPIVLVPNTERLQIARSTAPSSDELNTAFSFDYNGAPPCTSPPLDDPITQGIFLIFQAGSCADLPSNAGLVFLSPFVVHTVGHTSYGTFYSSNPPESVSARITQLATPAGTCGSYNLNVELAGITTAFLGNGPFALTIERSDGSEACFDITNAVVGGQIGPPAHAVKRATRR
jgi:hypothetical protein